MRTTPPTAAVSAVLACIQPDNPELVQRWADALASVGGLYATWDASALAAVARGSLAALRYALDHGATELPVEQARRYVDPPQYRRQPLDEFVLAGLRVEHALRAYVAAQSNVPEVSADAADRVELVKMKLDKGSRLLHKPFAKLQMPDQTLVAAIVRDGDVLVPAGADRLMPDDGAYIIGLPDRILAAAGGAHVMEEIEALLEGLHP